MDSSENYPKKSFKIGELKADSIGFDMKAKIIRVEPAKEVFSEKMGATLTTAYVLIGDKTGVINLSLWNEMIDKVEPGKTYEIKNAYVSIFNKRIQVNLSKKGEIIESKEEIAEINMENKMSEKLFQKKYEPPKKYFKRRM